MSTLRHLVEDPWFSSVRLGAVVVAWALWAWNPSWGWTVALALAPWLFQVLAWKPSFRPTFLDTFLVLFLLTAGVGLWAGYDRDGSLAVFSKSVGSNPIGWQKLRGLLLAALLYYALVATKTATGQRQALGLLTGLGAAVALVFAATHDWAAQPPKWELLARLGEAIQAPLPPLPRGLLNPNGVGGMVAPLLPLSLGLAADVSRKQTWPRVWGLLTGAAMALGLLLTTSRGAWIGVGGALALGGAWWLTGRLGRQKRRLAFFAGLLVLGLLAAFLTIIGVTPLRAMTLESLDLINRLDIFSQAVLLVRDYPFTGCGLGNFPLVHSTYALLIHVPILVHAHSLLLDIAVEQGIIGAVAAAVMWGGAGWLGMRELALSEDPRPVLAAGLLSLAVLVIHGLTDDPIYCGVAIPELWAPTGVVVATLRDRKTGCPMVREWRRLAVGIPLLGLLLLGLFGRKLTATWYANLGAVAQTLVELPAYDYKHFDNPTLDQIRQREDLSAAEAYFGRALALHPGQVTARTRLAHIALGRGEYETALGHTQAAWEAGHRDRLTRLLLGDALVAQGRVEEAATVVRGLGWAEWRLNGQVWYRYWIDEDWQRVVYAWQAVLMLDPEDGSAQKWIKIAEAKTAQAP
jgi:O-antigen ligase